jgi:hypothetical protein
MPLLLFSPLLRRDVRQERGANNNSFFNSSFRIDSIKNSRLTLRLAGVLLIYNTKTDNKVIKTCST